MKRKERNDDASPSLQKKYVFEKKKRK